LAGADGVFLLDDAGGLAGADDADLTGADELISNKKLFKEILPFFGTTFSCHFTRLFQVPTVLLLRPYLSRELVMNESENESVLPYHQELCFRKIIAICVF
jgi:hypothetical protein